VDELRALCLPAPRMFPMVWGPDELLKCRQITTLLEGAVCGGVPTRDLSSSQILVTLAAAQKCTA